ncbi:MAG TPA: ATP-binding protein [Flavisolibacter sp.]|nr:ATP-binding protein [Flavisolibacter sp.]
MKKIIIIGPESTGKSTLCEELAEHYGTAWCPEYAREYLLQNGTDYTYHDLTKIAQGQLAIEDYFQHEAKGDYYFVDTDLYVMKVWYEVAFHHCPTWILKEIPRRSCDLYLLCNTDLPWAKDELREYPDLAMRQKLFKMYKDIVINSGSPWVEISGTDRQRLHKAVAAINRIFNINKISA